jgi:hypothetical protein
MAGMLEDMRSEVPTMTTIDAHAHFLPDFYRKALLVARLRQAAGTAQLPCVGRKCLSDPCKSFVGHPDAI